MPRIAHVISTRSGLGGAEQVLAALTRKGDELGWEQVVLNPFAERGATPELAEVLEGVPYLGFHGAHLTRLLRARRWLCRKLASFAPDLVHAHLFHAMAATASLPRNRGVVRIATHHHGDFLRQQRRVVEQLIDRVSGRRLDLVVAVSDAVRDFLISDYGYGSAQVLTIGNGWQGDVVHSRTPPAERGVIVCVANFRPEKGHDVLLGAFQVVRRERDARLVLIGDGPLRGKLMRKVQAMGMTADVDFVGRLDNVWPHLAEADVFVAPSLSEPFGIAVLEAMAAGLPVIASAVGGLQALVKDGETGYLVSPGDQSSLARKMVALLDSPDARSSMGAAAQEVAERMKMDVTVDRYFDLYGRLLTGRPSDS